MAPAPISAPWGTAAAGDGGKRGREARGFHPPSHLGPGWSVEGGPRGLAAAVLGGSGGGAREPGRRNAGAAWLVVVVGDARGLFIGEIRRWGGGAPVVAGELVGATLMAAGPAVALCCAGVEASRGAVARSGDGGS